MTHYGIARASSHRSLLLLIVLGSIAQHPIPAAVLIEQLHWHRVGERAKRPKHHLRHNPRRQGGQAETHTTSDDQEDTKLQPRATHTQVRENNLNHPRNNNHIIHERHQHQEPVNTDRNQHKRRPGRSVGQEQRHHRNNNRCPELKQRPEQFPRPRVQAQTFKHTVKQQHQGTNDSGAHSETIDETTERMASEGRPKADGFLDEAQLLGVRVALLFRLPPFLPYPQHLTDVAIERVQVLA
uniref:Putative secreted protein n=1 Tax=Anopheles darlingi TaxID=43151 RepID=A0A2M4D1K4_ANODA